jgi:hypothetical protein
LWEYTGAAGGPNEFIVRDRRIVTMTTATASYTPGNLSSVVDPDRCIVNISGVATNHGARDGRSNTMAAWLDAVGDVQLYGDDVGGRTRDVMVEVIEFVGSNWTIHHGRTETAGTGTAWNGTVTLGSSVGDWNDALITSLWGSQDGGNHRNIEDAHPRVVPGSAANEVDWTLQDSTCNGDPANRLSVYVLENAEWSVTRYSTAPRNIPTTTTWNITSAGLTDLAQAGIHIHATSDGGGSAFGRGYQSARLTGLTSAESWQHRTGNVGTTTIQVIDFVGMTEAGASGAVLEADATAAGSVGAALTGASATLTSAAAAAGVSAATLTGTSAALAAGSAATGSVVAMLSGAAAALTSTAAVSGGASATLTGAAAALTSTAAVSGGASATLTGAAAALTSTAAVSGGASATLTGAAAALAAGAPVAAGALALLTGAAAGLAAQPGAAVIIAAALGGGASPVSITCPPSAYVSTALEPGAHLVPALAPVIHLRSGCIA